MKLTNVLDKEDAQKRVTDVASYDFDNAKGIVFVHLHGFFYDANIDDIYPLRVRWATNEQVDFLTVWGELCIGFDDYGYDWHIVEAE